MTDAHDQNENHQYIVHYPEHGPRKSDPNYKDFNAYHKKTRSTARCYIGEHVGYNDCRDAQGNDVPAPNDPKNKQDGLELHHTHIEFALTNGVNLEALEKDYPGVSDPTKIGAWVESGSNFRWLCCFHHRAAGGAHTASHSDWEGSQYIQNLITKKEAIMPEETVENNVAPVPTPPASWSNVSADIAYITAIALFIVGILTSLGVVIPDSVSHNIQLWAGVATQISGVVVALVNNIVNKSVLKVAIKANSSLVSTKVR